MRKLKILGFVVLSAFIFSFINDDRHVGKWKGESKNKVGYVLFDKEGYAAFEIEGQVMGGKEFEGKGKKYSMTYKIDETVKPVTIDFIVTEIESKAEFARLLGIMEYKGKNKMKLCLEFKKPSERPKVFTKDGTILLTKIE